jgi:hypothetical protein
MVGDGASQTTWAFEGGQAPAVAQALIFARHDRTAAWLRLEDRRYRLIESFRRDPELKAGRREESG